MPYPTGTCACGAEFAKVNRVRKTCAVCQVVRDMGFRPNLRKTCEVCEAEFFPIRSSYKTCPDCAVRYPQPDKFSACTVCGEHYRSAPGVSSVCVFCVMRSPEARRKYVATLERLVVARLKAKKEGGTVPQTWGDVIAQKEAETVQENASVN